MPPTHPTRVAVELVRPALIDGVYAAPGSVVVRNRDEIARSGLLRSDRGKPIGKARLLGHDALEGFDMPLENVIRERPAKTSPPPKRRAPPRTASASGGE